MVELEKIPTEQINERTRNIDSVPTRTMLEMINAEDKLVALAVEKELDAIAAAVDVIAACFRKGGRLIYVGCGTSGRLGVLDAVECPPTYSTPPEMVQGIIAGGVDAIFRAKEGAEDDPELGRKDLEAVELTEIDCVCGIAASGRTPYVLGALEYARSVGCPTISVSCNKGGRLFSMADYPIGIETGAEAVTGSTRMKSGTAQKMVLNMLSTGAMIRCGKVYGNLMVDVKPSNEKLRQRAIRIVMTAAGCSEQVAKDALVEAAGSCKIAIVMILFGYDVDEARKKLLEAEGRIADVGR